MKDKKEINIEVTEHGTGMGLTAKIKRGEGRMRMRK